MELAVFDKLLLCGRSIGELGEESGMSNESVLPTEGFEADCLYFLTDIELVIPAFRVR